MKVVINKCFGGFGLSRAAVLLGRELSGDPKWGGCSIKGDVYDDGNVADEDYGHCRELSRHDEHLVAVVERMGVGANGQYAALKVVEIPDGVQYEIDEYDGQEHIAEVHRVWG